MIVLAATGGKLTVLAESGSGTLAGSAHQKRVRRYHGVRQAALISEIFQQAIRRVRSWRETFSGTAAARLLRAGRDTFARSRRRYLASVNARKAGYEIHVAELSEKSGYTLKLLDYALNPMPKPPAPEPFEAERWRTEV